jgi:hypothetical protein
MGPGLTKIGDPMEIYSHGQGLAQQNFAWARTVRDSRPDFVARSGTSGYFSDVFSSGLGTKFIRFRIAFRPVLCGSLAQTQEVDPIPWTLIAHFVLLANFWPRFNPKA